MRLLLTVLFSLFSAAAFAKCNVFIPVKSFNASGYVINFDFTKMLYNKNYQEVYSQDEADYVLNLEGIEEEGRFHHAIGLIEMGPYKAKESVTCYTQLCAVKDYAKAFTKSYKKLTDLIPVCE